MTHTLNIYQDILNNPLKYDHYKVRVSSWASLDKVADAWITRISFLFIYASIYFFVAEYWWQYLLLPMHFFMGPIHGAIVNWCGHKYGYQNFENNDNSKNTLAIDFLMMGELYQNNHHKFPTHLKFAVKPYEIDFGYWSIFWLNRLKIIKTS